MPTARDTDYSQDEYSQDEYSQPGLGRARAWTRGAPDAKTERSKCASGPVNLGASGPVNLGASGPTNLLKSGLEPGPKGARSALPYEKIMRGSHTAIQNRHRGHCCVRVLSISGALKLSTLVHHAIDFGLLSGPFVSM